MPLHPSPVALPGKNLGRNDPCWCRSGKKYKHCHLGREWQKPIPLPQLMEEAMARLREKSCSHPEASPETCSRVIRAHTISRNPVLKSIAEDSHVYSTMTAGKDWAELERNWGRPTPGKIGIKVASTFFGFCGKHDNETFKPIERGVIDFDNRSMFLLSYRAVAHAKYGMAAQLHALRIFKKHGDRGWHPIGQAGFQSSVDQQIHHTEIGFEDLRISKEQYDAMLLSRDFTAFKWLAIRLDTSLPIVSAGGQIPDYDFEGSQLYDLNVSYEIIPLTTTIIINDQDGAIISMGWLQDDERSVAFAESFLRKVEKIGPDFVVHFGIALSANSYYRPSWWEGLSEADRQRLIDIMMSDYDPTVPHWFETIHTPLKFGLGGKIVDVQKRY